MMKFKIKTIIGDGLRETPPLEVCTNEDLIAFNYGMGIGEIVEDELFADHGELYGVGTVVTIERVE